jgi:glutathione S-transferase
MVPRTPNNATPLLLDYGRAFMKFYMTPGSCSTSIHIILEELEEVFEVYIMNLLAGDHFRPDYVAINPTSTIPALVRNDGSTLTEVPAIAYWLARTHCRAKLWPETPEDEARALEIIAYVVDTIHGQGFARIFATKTFASNPDEHQAVRQLGLDIIEKGFAILNDAIADKSYVVGDFSIADPIVFYVAFWADKTKIPMPDSLAAHYRRMLARPAVRRVLQEEGYNLATLGVSERQMRASSGAEWDSAPMTALGEFLAKTRAPE